MGQYEGAIQADQAQIDNANLQITYSKIIAPISGQIGLRLVDEGNIVRAADPGGMIVITQLQPISVLFSPSLKITWETFCASCMPGNNSASKPGITTT